MTFHGRKNPVASRKGHLLRLQWWMLREAAGNPTRQKASVVVFSPTDESWEAFSLQDRKEDLSVCSLIYSPSHETYPLACTYYKDTFQPSWGLTLQPTHLGWHEMAMLHQILPPNLPVHENHPFRWASAAHQREDRVGRGRSNWAAMSRLRGACSILPVNSRSH